MSLHQPSPLDEQEASAAASNPAQPGAHPGGFQAPAGFVLKGRCSRPHPACLLFGPGMSCWAFPYSTPLGGPRCVGPSASAQRCQKLRSFRL